MLNADCYKPQCFKYVFKNGVAQVSLGRPERKNPPTFDSYAELRDYFRELVYCEKTRAVVFTSNA